MVWGKVCRGLGSFGIPALGGRGGFGSAVLSKGRDLEVGPPLVVHLHAPARDGFGRVELPGFGEDADVRAKEVLPPEDLRLQGLQALSTDTIIEAFIILLGILGDVVLRRFTVSDLELGVLGCRWTTNPPDGEWKLARPCTHHRGLNKYQYYFGGSFL